MDLTTTLLVKNLAVITGSDTFDDVLIGELITAYSAQVETFCQQTFGAHTRTNAIVRARVDGAGRLLAYLPTPVAVLSSVELRSLDAGSSWSSLLLSTIELRQQTWCTTLYSTPDYRQLRGEMLELRLSYTGGYSSVTAVPADLEMAVRRLVWWAYKLRSAPLEKTTIPAQGLVIEVPARWPKDVLTALQPYVKRLA